MCSFALGSPLIRSVFKIGLFWQVAELRKEGRDGTCQVPTESSRGQSRINDRPAANLVFSLQVWWSGQPHPTLTVHPPGLSTLELYYTQRKKKNLVQVWEWDASTPETPAYMANLCDAPQPHLLYDMIQFKSSHSVICFAFPVSIGFLVCTMAVPPGITMIHRPLGHLGAHYMHENTARTEVHAQIH